MSMPNSIVIFWVGLLHDHPDADGGHVVGHKSEVKVIVHNVSDGGLQVFRVLLEMIRVCQPVRLREALCHVPGNGHIAFSLVFYSLTYVVSADYFLKLRK